MKGMVFESLDSGHTELILLKEDMMDEWLTGVKDHVKAKAERLRIGTIQLLLICRCKWEGVVYIWGYMYHCTLLMSKIKSLTSFIKHAFPQPLLCARPQGIQRNSLSPLSSRVIWDKVFPIHESFVSHLYASCCIYY